MAPENWQRRAAEAMIGLPPLVTEPTAEAVARGREALVALREQVSPDAPLVRELETALATAVMPTQSGMHAPQASSAIAFW